MSWDMNPYYDPEKFGLEILKSIEDPNSYYEFEDMVLWRHKETGILYYASDSGCSCPSPFEDFNSLADLSVLDNSPGSWEAFELAVAEWCGWQDRDDSSDDSNEGQWAVLRTDMLRIAAGALAS